MTTVYGTEAAESVEAVMAKVADGTLDVRAPGAALDESRATVSEIDSDTGVFTSVTVPVAGNYSVMSNLTVVLDPKGDVAQYAETLFDENSVGNFQITQYTDGTLTKTEDLGLSYRSDAELIKDMQETAGDTNRVSVQGVGSVASCLAGALGIGGVAAYFIAGACGGACAAGVVPVCAACVGAYAALGTGGMAAVVGCFQLL